MEKNFEHFFSQIGLQTEFEWGPDYWQLPHISKSNFTEEQLKQRKEKQEAEKRDSY